MRRSIVLTICCVKLAAIRRPSRRNRRWSPSSTAIWRSTSRWPPDGTLRRPYLQSFAELHGWRLVDECRPDQLQEWLTKHPEWKSDWTKRDAVMAVQTVFNWAKPKLVRENPFAGFHHRAGSPRRDLTPDEFQAILRATAPAGRRWKKPTPGARFRQILIFLHFTGCRPGEAPPLRGGTSISSGVFWCWGAQDDHDAAATDAQDRAAASRGGEALEGAQATQRKHVFSVNRRRKPWERIR